MKFIYLAETEIIHNNLLDRKTNRKFLREIPIGS